MIDPLHRPAGPDTYWTTINAEENLAGVVDPLSGTFWLDPVHRGAIGAFADMGVVPESAVRRSDDAATSTTSLIYGRYCVNVDLVSRLADITPGTSGEAMERDLFGQARTGVVRNRSVRRYPIVALKTPPTALRLPGRVSRALPRSHAWWQRAVAELDGSGDAVLARRRFAHGHAHMRAMMRPHTLGTMMISGVLEQVKGVADSAGRPELELELSRGLASLEEVGLLATLWDVSRGRGDLPGFVREYGYHGPGESAVSNRVWREDLGALERLVESYRGMDDERAPRRAAERIAAKRSQAGTALLQALPRARRRPAQLLLGYSDKLWALREEGKATYLHGIDVARAASRILGQDLAARGEVDDPADIAYLTVDEVIAGAPGDWREAVAFRRARREEYLTFDVPQTWTGEPERLPKEDDASDAAGEVTGLGASPGVAEGTVRVVHDPAATELEDGEILVCGTTDPSWSALFLVAAAAVIDVGARSSHGAIIARELGLPCVINTRTGTRVLRDGDRVRVDGGAGVVTVLDVEPVQNDAL